MEPTYVEFREQQYNEFYDFSLRITDKKELATTITDNAFDLLKANWEILPSSEYSHFLITTIYKAWQQHYEQVRNELVDQLPLYTNWF